MKQPALFLLLLLLSVTSLTTRAQDCPDVASLTSNKKYNEVFDTRGLSQNAGNYLAILASNLTTEQRVSCIASGGRQAVFPAKADGDLESVLGELFVNGAWVNDFLDQYAFSAGSLVLTASIWDDTTQSWLNDYQQFYTFNADGSFSEATQQTWDGNAYVNDFRSVFGRDGSGNLVSIQGFLWENDAWVVDFTSESTITNGLVTYNLVQFRENDVLVPFVQTFTEYDDQRRVISEVTDFYDETMGVFESVSRRLTTYTDLSSMSISEVYTRDINTGEVIWQAVGQTTITFNENGLRVEELNDIIFSDGEVFPFMRTTWAYNEMGLAVEIIDQDADGAGGYINIERNAVTYDADGDLIEDLYQDYVSTGKSESISGNTTVFSVNWENAFRDTYSYSGTSIAVEDEQGYQLTSFNVYPSPAQSLVNLEVNLDKPAALQVEVFDVLGRRIANLADTQVAAGLQKFTWEPGNLPAGVYFVRFQLNNKFETRSVFLIK